MGNPLSDSPEAIRQRNYRDRKRAAGTVTPPAGVTVTVTGDQLELGQAVPLPPIPPPPPPPPSSSSSSGAPWHETAEFRGPGPDAFATPLRFEPANDNTPPEPFAPPPPAADKPPPPPLSAAEVAPIALAVATYFEAGAMTLMLAYQAELAAMGLDAEQVALHLPTVKEVVRQSAERCAIKYRVRIPYQDEITVAGALGLATFGMVKGRAKLKADAAKHGGPAPTTSAPATPATPADEQPYVEMPIPKPAPAPPRDIEAE